MKLQENSKIKSVKLKDKAVVPAVGQGTWMMGEDQSKRKEEIAAIQCGIEYSLLPLMRKKHTALMAYCPLAQGGKLPDNILKDSVLEKLSKEKGITTAQLALAFSIRDGNTIAIPKAANERHVMENAKALEINLTQEDVRVIDQRFPAPKHKEHLDII